MSIWPILVERFDQLSRREQWLVALTGWVVLLLGGYQLLIEPVQQARVSTELQYHATQAEFIRRDGELHQIQRQLNTNPDKALDAQIVRLEASNARMDKTLSDRVASLVTPAQMATLMDQVLQHSQRLKLVSLESQPTAQLVHGEDAGYYIHPVRLTLRGRYFDLVNYLQQLEALPVKYYWRSLEYRVDIYPWSDITLDVYTLGESKDFIGG
ncbi:type II secretion system protein GspM [Photobacterium galatheae]|uniref:MSHA biogenesis protein MshJ n=1 Tax=Photobacterium galatheae TaxID=1654360 RepID=A0A066RYQ1_9GAMM|nr:type II secretion system protein GspM [Photobacterium galatheae]KDM92807.1 MSHA biogenesis protein MshJ [Photobacterium galatheae]MCM0149276.1 type 4a pilus biogenesis protein PilO [Photobacterium galatheae]